jgi:hypothetical protein
MKANSIAKSIIAMEREDSKLRGKLIKNGTISNGYDKEMEALHNRNANKLSDIIDSIGYPTADKVGKEASDAAWLIIQHSIGQPTFMRKCLHLLEEVVNENKADSINMAYLTDRIAVFENRPQLYGTQFDWDENGELNPNPFDNLEKVDQRRKSIGLSTLEEQIEVMRKRSKNEKQSPPKDFLERKSEVEKWKQSVGWT